MRVLGVTGRHPPTFVSTLLLQPAVMLVARLGLTSPFWLGGLNKLADWPGAIAEAGHVGLHPAWLVAAMTVATEFGASALVVANRHLWLGAGSLGVFTGLATLVAHRYWAETGLLRSADFNSFWEHVALIAAFVIAAASSGPDERRAV